MSCLIPANILIDQNFSAKIIDFSNNPTVTGSTLLWTAPECMSSQSVAIQRPSLMKKSVTRSANQLSSDVYAFGVVVYECLSRREPFEGHELADVVAGVSTGLLRLPIPPGCSAEIAVLLNECLSFEPISRPPFAEIERRLATLDQSKVTSDAFSTAEGSSVSKRSRLPELRGSSARSSSTASTAARSLSNASMELEVSTLKSSFRVGMGICWLWKANLVICHQKQASRQREFVFNFVVGLLFVDRSR